MKKSNKKSLLLSITALIVCCAMLAGTTLAWFTDSVSSGTNKIEAGNLDIEVYHTNASVSNEEKIDSQTNLFRDKGGNAMKWEPGAVAYETFDVKNVGNLALKYNLKMNITDYNAVSGTNDNLKQVLKVKVLRESQGEMMSTINRDTVTQLNWSEDVGALDAFQIEGDTLFPEGDGRSSEKFQVVVYWQPHEDDNRWNVNNGKTTTDGQPLYINFGINVTATQKDHENDSFDNTYDKDTVIPNLPASVEKTFTATTTAAKTDAGVITYTGGDVEIENPSSNTVGFVPEEAVSSVVANFATNHGDKVENGTSIDVKIEQKISTESKTENSATYQISFNTYVTYTDSDTNEQTTVLVNGVELAKPALAPVEVGTGLTNVTVIHKTDSNPDNEPMTVLTKVEHDKNLDGTGAVEGSYYDPATGVLNIWSKTNSPFEVSFQYNGVAVINSTLYETLEDAIAAAKDKDTITLLKDISATVSADAKVAFTVDKNVTLNGNGKTITVKGNSSADTYAIKTTAGGSIQNLKLNVTGVERAIRLEGTDSYKISSTKITGTGVGIHVKGAAEVTLDQVDVTINAETSFSAHKRTGVMVGAAANVTLSNSNVNVTASDKNNDDTVTWGKGLYVGTNAKGHMTVVNTNVNADFAIAIDGSSDSTDLNSITINSGNFTGKAGSPSGYSYKEVIIHGGTFNDFGFAANTFYDTTNPTARMIIDGGTFSIDPSDYLANGYNVNEENGRFVVYAGTVVCTAEQLKDILTQYTSAGSGDNVVSIVNDLRLADGEKWEPAKVDGYNGAGVITVNGNGHTIYGLNAPLFAGGFAGNSGIIVNDLTIDGAEIDDDYADQGLGAFICSIDSMPTITLNNCHLKNSTITSTGGARVGGLIGWTAGYNNPNDGPVDTFITVQNCSVENCEITAAGSVGAIIGHAGNNPATFHTITNNTVKNCKLHSTDDGDWRVGVVVGTANVGQVTISGTTESGNTLTQVDKTAPEHSNLYGRFVPGDTGILTIDGTAITNN